MIRQFQSAREALESGIAKNSIRVFAGNIVGATAGLAVSITFAKHLGPAEFGLLSSCLFLMNLLIQISDAGLEKTTVRYSVGGHLGLDLDEVFRSLLILRAGLGALIAGIVYIFRTHIAVDILQKPDLAEYISLIAIGIFFGSVNQMFLAKLQALASFTKYCFLRAGVNVFKVTLLLGLLTAYVLTVWNAVMITILAIIIGTAFAVALLWKVIREKKKVRSSTLLKLLPYSKWVTVMQWSSILVINLPVLILTRYCEATEVGYYSAAAAICMGISFVSEAIGIVLFPRYSMFSEANRVVTENRIITRWLLVLCIPGFFLILFARPITVLVYGISFRDASPIFSLLVFGSLVDLAFKSYTIAMLRANEIYLSAIVGLSRLFVLLLVSWFLIDNRGSLGVAAGVVFSGICGAVLSVLFVNKSLAVEVGKENKRL